MQPQDDKQQEWQQPQQALNQAPFQPVAEAPAAEPAAQPIAQEAPLSQGAEVSSEANEDDQALIRWQATEYMHQERNPLWFAVLALVAIVLVILALVIMKSITFAILIPVMAVTLIMYVRRPPALNDYIVSRKGLHINDRLYTYDQFRSFGVVQHGGHNSIVLVPRKRFQLGQTLYFPDEVGEPLVDMLAARLPMKEAAPDIIDKILTKLHL
jgi:hypothetical protein